MKKVRGIYSGTLLNGEAGTITELLLECCTVAFGTLHKCHRAIDADLAFAEEVESQCPVHILPPGVLAGGDCVIQTGL